MPSPASPSEPLAQCGGAERASVASALDASAFLRGIAFDPQVVRVRRTAKGQDLADHEEPESCVVLVARGSVDAYSTAVDGREVRLSTLGPGDAFGVCNLFAASDLPTRLRSRGEGLLALIPKELVAQAVLADPETARRYMRLCNEKIQFLIGRIEELTMQTARGKLLDYLVLHADENGVVHLGCSREELAGHLGVSRASLFREISALKRKGVLSSEGRDLHICTPAPPGACS